LTAQAAAISSAALFHPSISRNLPYKFLYVGFIFHAKDFGIKKTCKVNFLPDQKPTFKRKPNLLERFMARPALRACR
jgi:hypothetical protein